jgi:hypothetical protein
MTDDPTPSDVARWHETLGKNHRREVVWVNLTASQLFVAWMLRHLLRNRDIAGGFLRAQ